MKPYAIDLHRRHDLDGDSACTAQHRPEQPFSLAQIELLRIVQAGESCGHTTAHEVVVEENAGGDEWSCEAATAGLVGTSHEARPEASVEVEQLPAGARHRAETTRQACRFSRMRAFLPTLLRR